MLTTSRRRTLGASLAALLTCVTLAATAGPASAAGAVETMPLWRLQVRLVTGDTAAAGTTGTPALRFNGSSTGVRSLNATGNPWGASHNTVYDLRLFDSPSQMTMLRIGVTGTDDWCIKRTELLFNGRVAFAQDAVPGSGGACVSIRGGTYLEYSYAAMRSNPAWISYGTPPAYPRSLPATSLRQIVAGVTGSAMLSTGDNPTVRWDVERPLVITRKTSTSINISYGIRFSTPVEPTNTAIITYDVRLFRGTDDRLHAAKANPSCCYHYTMSDAVVAQLDTALSRMSVRPGAAIPLRFTIDSLTTISWS
jgi:hypothetical protein